MAAAENHLIELLPRDGHRCLLAVCVPVELALGEVLYERGSATRHVYFPVDGFISLVARIDEHPGLEVGRVGREGMPGLHLALGVSRAPLHALVQGAGAAWRITATDFRRELAHGSALRNILTGPIAESPSTAQRIRDAARAMGYIPSAAARILRSGKSNLVLGLLPAWDLGSAFPEILRGLGDRLGVIGHDLVLYPAGHAQFIGRQCHAAQPRERLEGLQVLNRRNARCRHARTLWAIQPTLESLQPSAAEQRAVLQSKKGERPSAQ